MPAKSRWSARRVVLGLILALPCVLFAAPVASASAALVMESPEVGATTNATPQFSGTTTELLAPVTVEVYEGSTVGGTALETLPTGSPLELGSWSVSASPSLAEGTYTAVAQQEVLGAPETTLPVTFKVVTKPPSVELEALVSPSKVTRPTFKGSSNEAGEVTVRVYEGASSSGSEVASVTGSVAAGKWSAGPLGSALASGEYTAVAVQESKLGNGPGSSNEERFVVDTESPQVTLVGPPARSKDTTPSFSGTASEAGSVTVHVHKGSTVSGSEVAKVTVSTAGGGWEATLGSALAEGEYTAVATEPSSLGNPEGSSNTVTFEVVTAPPTVTLAAPPARSKDTTPTFEGTTSEGGEVKVEIHAGSASGSVVATAVAHPSTEGKWTSGAASPALGEGSYTAVAVQASSLGLGSGSSKPVSFEVVTAPPTLELQAPPSPSKDTTPSFKGSTSEAGEVTIDIYAGPTASGPVVATAAAHPSVAGSWTSAAAGPALSGGEYTAMATEPSSLGNGSGSSGPVSFVVDTEAPRVTLVGPPARSKDTTPSFSGTASESGSVTVHVHKGSTVSGSEVAKVTVSTTGGNWEVTLGSALAEGEYTAVATEPSSLGNPEGVSKAVTFEVVTAPPSVSLQKPESPSKNTKPVFKGTTSEAGEVKVSVYVGASATGTPVATAVAHPSGAGSWTSAAASPALSSGEYTAVAVQESALGNGPGKSGEVTLVVNTEAPRVTLVGPPARSKNATPSFSGTASEAGEVTVHVHKGATLTGSEVAKVTVSTAGGDWEVTLGSALAEGEYTAVATEPSSLGNGEGTSSAVTFEVVTKPPAITLEQPISPSGNATPTFKGATSEAGTVTVQVYAGSSVSGSPVATAVAHPSGAGSWTSSAANPALSSGEYTAMATQESGLGNGPGSSKAVSFVVDTAPPAVSLLEPESPSKNTKPVFKGATSEAGTVTVQVYAGSSVSGTLMATAVAHPSGPGGWTSSAASPALASGEYTAVATQESALGNGPGSSSPVTFIVNTEAPKLTLTRPASPSKNTKPSFKGTTSEAGTVTVRIYKGSKPEGTEAASVAVQASAGEWTTAALGSALAEGEYTAVAKEPSSLGNAEGTSNAVTFEVITKPPAVTLEQPVSPTGNTTPTFKGTTSEAGTVTVQVYAGSSVSGSPVATAVAHPAGAGAWISAATTPALASGEYTAMATQESGLGNGPGSSKAESFVVDTAPPSVSLQKPESPSKNTKPIFKGTTSEAGEVKVEIHAGSVSGAVVSTAVAHPSAAGSWTSAAASPALASGEYTAVATQESALGNGPGSSSPVSFVVNTAPPKVTIKQPATPSKDTTPSFEGTASEAGTVTVHVYKGSKPEGKEVATLEADVVAGTWSSPEVSPALADGEYNAVATEPSALGNGPGTSSTVIFVVNTKSPIVTIEQPESPTRETEPKFTGEASANTEVVVHIYSGSKAQGTPVATATATGNEHKWSSGAASPALATGVHTYTAVAEQASPLGNAPGKSSPVTFMVDTNPPTVSLQTIETPSKVTRPSFEGSASETTPVVVHVYKGTKVEGPEAASVTASGTGGPWKSGPISPALADGTYIAVATQESAIGNGPGTSNTVTFEVNTKPPTVTLNQPTSPSRNTKPTFTGTASATTQVVVHIYEGTKASGTQVASATATGTGSSWTSSAASPALASEDRTYTAVATQESPLGNPAGESNPVTFIVNTEPPQITLEQPKTPSNNTTPSFSGKTNANTEVVVHVYEGTKVEPGKEVTKISGTASEGAWSSGTVTLASGEHTYTAEATEVSPISGNPEGKSAPVTFFVDTESPTVTLNQPTTPSNETVRSFKGTASANTNVVVHIYEGTGTSGTEVSKVTATVSSGEWTSGTVTLPGGERTYTAMAEQSSPLGNPPGKSKALTFFIDTEAPKVNLEQPLTPSNNTTPTLGGTTNAETSVVVHVFEGATEVAKAAATASAGKWSTPVTLPTTGEHTYTAYATQVSPFKGNLEGKSTTVTFLVDKEAPKIVLSQLARSNNATPSFAGTTNANTEVVVHVFEGTEAKGTEIAQVPGKVTEGAWTSGQAKLATTGEHTYTAYATQVSPFTGNPTGKSTSMTFTISLLPPTVTLSQTKTPSSNTKPSFSGTASEKAPVTLKVYAGTKVEGTPVATKTAAVENGTWKVSEVPLATGKHTYTAVASEPSEIGNSSGESAHDVFEVNTEPPTVTLNPVAEISNNTTPSFKGTASDTTIVTVKVYAGKIEGVPIRTVKAQPSAGAWATAAVNPKLENGKYMAVATQESSLGNHEGESSPIGFEINTASPTVTLNQPPARSKENTLSFSGTASEKTEVTVEIYEGTSASGNIVEDVKATGTGATWTSGKVTLPIGNHPFTAVAIQTSELKNVPGESAPVTFVIDTQPPEVTLNQPTSPSSLRTPRFSGTSNEATPVTIDIYEGANTKVAPVSTATATPSSSEDGWTSGAASPLPEGLHTFTAVARQPSGIGNVEGESASVTFTVDTLSPTVTLRPVAAQGDAKPSFSGLASERGPVTVEIYEGASVGKNSVGELIAEDEAGEWITGQLPQALANGVYTAIATQKSMLGNPSGTSAPVTFTVNTSAPTVTAEPSSAIKNTSAQLNVSVNPNNGNVSSCSIEFGSTTSYGTVLECAFSNGADSECTFSSCAFPSSTSTVAVYARVDGLAPSSKYYFRAVATNERGSGFSVGSFTTSARSSISGGGAVLASTASSAGPSVAAGSSSTITALIAGQLSPSGRAARIAALLKSGAYKERFKAPAAGTASIKWYYLPPGTKLGGKGRHAPVLVASGSARFNAAGVVATIKVRLTGAGRRLLGHAKQLRLTATCVFTPTGTASTTVSRKFELKR